MVGLLFLPDSPRWLLMNGRNEEAHDVISRLLGKDLQDPEVLEEMRSIQESLYIQNRGGGFRYRELLTNGPSQNFRRTFLGALSQFCQQFCGINLVVSTFYRAAMTRHIMLTKSSRPTMPRTFSRTLSVSMQTCLVLFQLATALSISWLLFSPSRPSSASVAAF